jgi:hypothetical protein
MCEKRENVRACYSAASRAQKTFSGLPGLYFHSNLPSKQQVYVRFGAACKQLQIDRIGHRFVTGVGGMDVNASFVVREGTARSAFDSM